MTSPRPAAGGGRLLGVAPERLDRWLDGVAQRHGAFTDVRADEAGVLTVTCQDTTTVRLTAPYGWTPGPVPLTAFSAAAKVPQRTAVLLVRRGRWAVGVFDGAELVVSKVDARQVQGRTAAGGWSQQRFARRRGHQTDAVVSHAADTAARVLLPHAGTLAGLAPGGDKGLAAEVLTDPRLRPLADLPRLPALEVGEPTKAVLLETPAQFRAVRVHIVEPTDRG
ncbi:acVLRF1 family peptidyl-tRNA hydrolase [Modestobacter sp. VKM Ac-2977]|uniref:acVLRF1 family peptidyl-tRNA hydrolase n=1 Tax=Modestobacter sp. VKM Ac-2977 TaxID=3004131 RepID=UPI0022AA342B|nr:acVLRF1 family peptidyl-tRNA hydrolase [Modestobacter sp. VKM Ac-2977]MCZ2821707.1 acVLRF1 family peptidyl-tRNA hydrolase [Modestobacter sp. VKM Ac-2977]